MAFETTRKMSYPTQSTSSSPEATPARRNKTEAELLQILFDDIRSKSGPFSQNAERVFAHFVTRADVLGGGELRMLIDYAGRTLESRTGVLEKILSHRVENGDQPPITRGAGTGKDEEWICQLCPELDPNGRPPFAAVFQKVAIHITSRHWGLRSWICPEDSCNNSYQSHDSLTRHKKHCHDSNGQPDTISAPSAQAEAIDTVSPQFQSSVEPTPALPASTSEHIRHAVNWSSQGRPPVLPQFYETIQAPFVRDKLPAPPPSPFSRPVPNAFVGTGVPNPYYPHVYGTTVPNPYHPYMYGIDASMNSSAPHVTNVAHHFHRTGGAHYVQTNAAGFPVTQYHYPQSNMNQRNIPGPSFYEPAFSQPGPSSPFASNIAGRSRTYRVRPNHSRSYYNTPRDEMRRQAEMPRASPPFGRSGRPQFAGSTEELGPNTLQSPDQGVWWPAPLGLVGDDD